MTKRDLAVGMLVVTENGVARIVMPTKANGLVLVSQDNNDLKVDKLNDDLTRNRYKAGNDVVKVYDIMDDVNGELFSETGRTLLFDRTGNADTNTGDDECVHCECDGTCYGCVCDVYDDRDDEEECDADDADDVAETTGFTKANVTPGMLAVTRDGQNRLAIPTADMGLVLAAPDSKFVRLDKLNNDLTIADYRKDGKNVDKVYGLADGVTTDFYSTDNRALLFDRGNN